MFPYHDTNHLQKCHAPLENLRGQHVNAKEHKKTTIISTTLHYD